MLLGRQCVFLLVHDRAENLCQALRPRLDRPPHSVRPFPAPAARARLPFRVPH